MGQLPYDAASFRRHLEAMKAFRRRHDAETAGGIVSGPAGDAARSIVMVILRETVPVGQVAPPANLQN